MRLKQFILVVVALMLLATGCAGDDTAAPTPSSTASTSTTTQPTTTVATTTTTTVATTTTMPVVTDDEEKVAYRSVQEFAENLRQGDMEAAAAFLGPGIGFYDLDFWEWTSILEKVEFTDCLVLNETADGSEINCTWRVDEDSWFSLVLGQPQATSTFWAAVDTDGVLTKISSAAAPGAKQAERDFREWIRATHPEDEDRMFGPDSAAFFRFSKESAELHMHYLDEYLAYLETKQLDTSEPWDLVWFSDSRGFRVAEAWADRIEEAEGVEVRVHDHAIANLSSLLAVQLMVSNQVAIREEVADAEIIVVFGTGAGPGPEDKDNTCAWPDPTPRDPPEPYSKADWAPFGNVLRAILDEIFELRAGQPTVIRVADEFAAMLADWREAGIEAECTAGWEAQQAVIREVADEYGVGMASWYDFFNGPDHDEDPREKGYIASDGFHTSPEGTPAQVEVLHALGYDPIVP